MKTLNKIFYKSILFALVLGFNLASGAYADGADPELVKKYQEMMADKKKLRLFNQWFGVEGAKAIAEALKSNNTLTDLELSVNNIGDEGAEAIADALKSNSTLIYIFLGSNKISDKGAEAIADALKSNSTLIYIFLGENNISQDLMNLINQRLERNKKIPILTAKLAALVPGFKDKHSYLSTLVPDVQFKILQDLIAVELNK